MDDDLGDIYDRLRETEAETREQNIQIKELTKQTAVYIDILKQSMANTEKREANFWKVITYLILALVALALGPRLAKELVSMKLGSASYSPAIPMNITHNDDRILS